MESLSASAMSSCPFQERISGIAPVDRRFGGREQLSIGGARFTWLRIRSCGLGPLVFLINGITKHNWTVAFHSRWPSPWADPGC